MVEMGQKEQAKAEKKRTKTELKVLKKKAEFEQKYGPSAQSEERKKSWRDNPFLYIVMAVLIGITLWFVGKFLGGIFG